MSNTDFPDVKLKALVNFPATAIGGTGIDVTKTNGNFVVDLAYDEFAPVQGIPTSDFGNLNALLWNKQTQAYTLTPISLFGAPGGIPDAPSDGTIYARLNAAWTPSPGGLPAVAVPLMDATPGLVGTSVKYAREDHAHPTDTSRAPLLSPVFTGNPTAPSPAIADSSQRIATTAWVQTAITAGGTFVDAPGDNFSYGRVNGLWGKVLPLAGGTLTGALVLNADPTANLQAATKQYVDNNAGGLPSNAVPGMNGVGAAGASTQYARGDHIHPTDTSRAPLVSPALTGVPTAPTATAGTNTTQIATTAFVLANGGAGVGAPVFVSDTPPPSPADGALWWESDTGLLYIRFNDGNSTQWVIACPQPDPSTFVTITPQTLTSAQQVQVRQNIYAAPFDALAYSGMQINGSMDVSQEKGFSAPVTNNYVCDSWYYAKAGTLAANCGVYAVGAMFSGIPNAMAVVVQTAQASMGAGDYSVITHNIEGYRVARLAWGTANAQPITIGFWTNHHRTGLYTGTLRNAAQNRCYAFSYTHNVADVPQFNVITIPGDTSGTWAKDNTLGVGINFAQACGTTSTAPSLNTWLAGNYIAGPGQINAVAATSDVFYLTGVVVLPGIEAPSAARSALIMRPYDQELLTCKRYWQSCSYDDGFYLNFSGYEVGGTTPTWGTSRDVEMRSAPTGLFSGAAWSAGNCSQPVMYYSAKKSWAFYTTVTATGHFSCTAVTGTKTTFDARL